MPTNPSVETLRNRARQLRRQQSEAEKCLWAVLRARQFHGYKFRRQFVIGSVIADFCCFEHRIVIEIDGGQHADQTAADQSRSAFLRSRGFRVLRFWNNEVLQNLDGLLEKLNQAFTRRHQTKPSPSGRGTSRKRT